MSLSINSVSSYNNVSRYERESQYRKAGIPDDIIAQGQTAIENYAFENSITLPDFTTQDEESLFDFADNEEVAEQNQPPTDAEAKKMEYKG